MNGFPQGVPDQSVAALPTVLDPPRRRLPRRALAYLNIRAALVWAVMMTAVLSAVVVAPTFIPVWLLAVGTSIATVSLIVDLAFIHPWHCRTYRYELTPDATRIGHGRVFLRERSIPTRRTFGVEIVQGPLLRAFGLVELRIVTVVGTHPLGPVPQEDADQVRAIITGAAERDAHA